MISVIDIVFSNGYKAVPETNLKVFLGSSLFCVDIFTKTNVVKLENHLIHRE